MKKLFAAFGAAGLLFVAAPAMADDDPTAEQIAKITEVLAAQSCDVDPDEIEVEADGGFDVDDVACLDGQYDVKLDKDFNVIGMRKE